MQVTRLFEQVKNRRVQIELPDEFNNRQVEIIILTMDDPLPIYRRPHPDIAGKVIIHGNIFDSIPDSDWNLPI